MGLRGWERFRATTFTNGGFVWPVQRSIHLFATSFVLFLKQIRRISQPNLTIIYHTYFDLFYSFPLINLIDIYEKLSM